MRKGIVVLAVAALLCGCRSPQEDATTREEPKAAHYDAPVPAEPFPVAPVPVDPPEPVAMEPVAVEPVPSDLPEPVAEPPEAPSN